MNVHELVAPCLTSVEQLGGAAIAELRSDHAGETGAVCIYEGILAVSQSTELRAFAESHLRAEQIHLAALDRLLPYHLHSKCLPLWRVAGWGLGAFAALLGPHFTYA
ncbi:MAG TPA: demethoxyubiquinone hydroxylase family protein, partial [Gammaproteobacteria bacterium]|nr:demethoxyubiquinone hydroxylase family protein [Gammaproteobacteria bacterium]